MKKTISMNVTRVHVDVCDEINIKLQCVDLRAYEYMYEHEKREYICRANSQQKTWTVTAIHFFNLYTFIC